MREKLEEPTSWPSINDLRWLTGETETQGLVRSVYSYYFFFIRVVVWTKNKTLETNLIWTRVNIMVKTPLIYRKNRSTNPYGFRFWHTDVRIGQWTSEWDTTEIKFRRTIRTPPRIDIFGYFSIFIVLRTFFNNPIRNINFF